MKKTLKALLVIAAVMGMVIPVMANPENEPIVKAANVKGLLVDIGGGNAVNDHAGQSLANLGTQTSWGQGMAIAGSALGTSANEGYASSGAASVAANSNDAMGNSNAESGCIPSGGLDNTDLQERCAAVNAQTSDASVDSGSVYGFDDVVSQANDVAQEAMALFDNDQTSTKTVDITDLQGAGANATGDQSISDSILEENGWRQSVIKNIN